MIHISLYIINGFAPSPQVTMKFNTQEKDPVNGNDFITSALGKNIERRHQEFKALFFCVDSAKLTPPRKSHPNRKVQFFK